MKRFATDPVEIRMMGRLRRLAGMLQRAEQALEDYRVKRHGVAIGEVVRNLSRKPTWTYGIVHSVYQTSEVGGVWLTVEILSDRTKQWTKMRRNTFGCHERVEDPAKLGLPPIPARASQMAEV